MDAIKLGDYFPLRKQRADAPYHYEPESETLNSGNKRYILTAIFTNRCAGLFLIHIADGERSWEKYFSRLALVSEVHAEAIRELERVKNG